MCLTSPSQHHQVMSSGDSSIVVPSSSSTPNSDTKKLAPSNQIEVNEQENTSSSHLHLDTAEKINLADSISDLEIQEQAMAPSHSNSSLENAAHRVVTSLEGDTISLDEETGEMIQRGGDARSGFFAIIGVRPTEEDLDKSRHTVVSNDQIVVEKGASGESEDSTTGSNEKHQPPGNQDAPSLVKSRFIVVDVPVSDYLEIVDKETEDGGGITLSPKAILIGESSSSSASGGMVAIASNGSSLQPNRFRRVNQYERGRWTVRDSLVTEEQADNLPASAKDQGSKSQASDTSPKTTQQRSDLGPTLVEHSHLLTELGLPGMLGGGGGADSVSDKDSSSIPLDRSSTAAETLSRNTSMSSIIAPEKSVDGDDILHADTDTESVAGASSHQNSTEHEDVPLVSPQPPNVPTSSSGAVPPPSSTALPREDQPTPAASTPALDSDVDITRVKDAMSFLQKELTQVLTSSSYPILMEENRTLKDHKLMVDQENIRLKEELLAAKEELRLTKDENLKLSKELKELRSSLTRLAQPTSESSGSGSVIQSGLGVMGDDQLSSTQSSNDTTSSNSQGVIT